MSSEDTTEIFHCKQLFCPFFDRDFSRFIGHESNFSMSQWCLVLHSGNATSLHIELKIIQNSSVKKAEFRCRIFFIFVWHLHLKSLGYTRVDIVQVHNSYVTFSSQFLVQPSSHPLLLSLKSSNHSGLCT